MKKRLLAFALMMALVMGCLIGCASKEDEGNTKVVLNEVAHSIFYAPMYVAIENGYLSEEAIMESLLSIKRAGADLIITNFAPYALDHL